MGAAEMANAVAFGVRQALRRGMRVLEPQKGAWVNQNLWGDQRTQALPGVAGQVVSVLGKNTIMYGPPAVHSVALVRSDEVNAGNADVYALVTAGCGGIENKFMVDWTHGAQFSLVCNSLSVAALSYAPAAGFAYDASDASIFLGAMVCKGTVAQGRCPATFTEPRTDILHPGSAVFNVPDFAREVTVNVSVGSTLNNNPATATLVVVRFVSKGGAVLAEYDAQVCAGGRSIPVPGGSNQIIVVNGSAAVAFTTVVWFLGL